MFTMSDKMEHHESANKISVKSLTSEISTKELRGSSNEAVLAVSSNAAPQEDPDADLIRVEKGTFLSGPTSKFAFVTLISGIDSTYKYRGYLINALIIRKSLTELGSKADFVALIGFAEQDTSLFDSDIELLKSHGIRPFILPRLVEDFHKLGFAEMALLKITPWSFLDYERVQFFDGDVMPTKNMDCFFKLKLNAFTVGLVSPLNSGWYLAIPNMDDYIKMREKAVWRLGRDWDTTNGWAEPIVPNTLTYRGGKKFVEQWLFNGADMDQGLLTYYFVLNEGRSMLIDTDMKKAKVFVKGMKYEPKVEVRSMREVLSCCDGQIPTSFYSHFTGKSKPWLNKDIANASPIKGNGDLHKWKTHLDGLKLDGINSSNIASMEMKPPLGYFNANFPKGGFTTPKAAATTTATAASA